MTFRNDCDDDPDTDVAPRRCLLAADQAALPQAAAALLDRFGAEMGGVAVVLPVSRAGRRLLEWLVDLAAERGLTLVPPRITTTGSLIDLLFAPPDRPASPIVRRLVWAAALREAEPEVRDRIAPRPPKDDDLLGWAAVAEQIEGVHVELAGENLDFADAADRAEQLPDFNDSPRWRAMQQVREAYLTRLESLGLVDPYEHRRRAAAEGEFDHVGELVLIAAVDLNAVQRTAVQRVAAAGRLTLMIHSPADRAADFDALGCLHVDAWAGSHLPLRDEQIDVADKPADQAIAVTQAIDALGGRFAAEQITVGVCDPSLTASLHQQLQSAGLPARDAVGVELSRTAPLRLLTAAADWIERQRFADLATLLRHPDVESIVTREPAGDEAEADEGADTAAIEDWLTLMDRYYTQSLAGRITGQWLGDPDVAEPMKRVHGRVQQWLSGLLAPERPMPQWAQPILDWLLATYADRPLDRAVSADRVLIETLQRITDVLSELHELHVDLTPPVSAAVALRLLYRHATQREPIAPLPLDAAIELLGPLELHLDDAPVLLITAFNEGFMPASITADAFLPNSLRHTIRLVDNTRRYARDAYALHMMLLSRPHVRLIVGRRSASGDPLTPSRLLFACDDARMVRRVQRCFGESTAELDDGALFAWIAPGREQSDLPIPPLPAPARPIHRLRVTAFRDYLACPYRFYLRHILRLQSLDDTAEELDPPNFGTLAHDVLYRFGSDESLRDIHDADRIADQLDRILDARVAQRFGRSALAAVPLQVEQLRRRLHVFARWQADWVKQGWRIEHVELDVHESPASLPGVDPVFELTGRIDRVDVNTQTGERIVFDYKTGENAKTPEQTHRNRDGWIDLQLPLYRHLLAHLGIATASAGDVSLGYILLPRDPSEGGMSLAEWSADELAEADETARGVVRGIRAGHFPLNTNAGAIMPEYDAICQVARLAESIAEADAGVGDGGDES